MAKRRFVHSWSDAWRGIRVVFASEQNFRFQIIMGVAVLLLIAYFRLPVWQIIVLLLLIALVLVLELINTAVEYFTDLIKPRLHPHAGTIKDIMAGAVLIASCVAVVIGLLIFLPYFMALVK